MPLPFLLRALVAGIAGFMLLALSVRGALADVGWAMLALAVGSELVASAVFVWRSRGRPPGRRFGRRRGRGPPLRPRGRSRRPL